MNSHVAAVRLNAQSSGWNWYWHWDYSCRRQLAHLGDTDEDCNQKGDDHHNQEDCHRAPSLDGCKSHSIHAGNKQESREKSDPHTDDPEITKQIGKPNAKPDSTRHYASEVTVGRSLRSKQLFEYY